ncbi:hypothetical protein S40293_10225 [Stachybotrys chartarum IBT 40293]|nr:hypothetical protein S40293_10225 [Stachybotrys chartarum IBT 40293]
MARCWAAELGAAGHAVNAWRTVLEQWMIYLLRKEKYNNEEELCRFFRTIEDQPRDLFGPVHQRLVMHCLSEAVPARESQEFNELRKDLEDQLKRWLLFECNFESNEVRLQLAAEMEFPDQILDAVLQEGSKDVVSAAGGHPSRHGDTVKRSGRGSAVLGGAGLRSAVGAAGGHLSRRGSTVKTSGLAHAVLGGAGLGSAVGTTGGHPFRRGGTIETSGRGNAVLGGASLGSAVGAARGHPFRHGGTIKRSGRGYAVLGGIGLASAVSATRGHPSRCSSTIKRSGRGHAVLGGAGLALVVGAAGGYPSRRGGTVERSG